MATKLIELQEGVLVEVAVTAKRTGLAGGRPATRMFMAGLVAAVC